MPTYDGVYYVSGAASGLGLATAKSLIEKKAHVVLLDINEEAGEALEKELGQDKSIFSKCDVRDEASIVKAIQKAEKRWPNAKTRGAINCGGVGYAQGTVSKSGKPFDLEAFKMVIDINLTGSFNLARLVAARIVQQEAPLQKPASIADLMKVEPFPHVIPGAVNEDRGIIIFTASVAATDGQDGQAAYSASKAGLTGLTLPMARDLAKFGIRVMTIAPSTFETAMGGAIPLKARANLLGNSVFPPRSGNSTEFAALVLAIVENPMLNGSTIRIDGATRMNKL